MKRVGLFLVLLLVLGVSVVAAQDSVSLVVLVDDSQQSLAQTNALIDAFTAQNPNISVEIETRLQGTEGDNIVKTRLATQDMTDVFFYNSGSLLQALNPQQTLVDLSGQPFMDNVVESFLPTVSQGDGVFGVPVGTAMGGGILYNRRVYDELGLSVPKTWDEFVANNQVIADAGKTPVIATFGDTWTSQLFVLGDYFNVAQAVPGFAEMYTANEAKYATTPAAMAGFAHLQQGYELGWWERDYATMRYEQGLGLLASGDGVHFPMLMFAMTTIAENYPDQVNDIGFFGQPGSDADVNGATVWMPGAAYIPQTTTGAKLDAALAFVGFIASVDGADAITSATPPSGPYLIKGASLPDDVLPAVKDLAAYIDSGNSFPALEFLSRQGTEPGAALRVSRYRYQMSAEEAAANYDLDVERQAQQLGLPGW